MGWVGEEDAKEPTREQDENSKSKLDQKCRRPLTHLYPLSLLMRMLQQSRCRTISRKSTLSSLHFRQTLRPSILSSFFGFGSEDTSLPSTRLRAGREYLASLTPGSGHRLTPPSYPQLT